MSEKSTSDKELWNNIGPGLDIKIKGQFNWIKPADFVLVMEHDMWINKTKFMVNSCYNGLGRSLYDSEWGYFNIALKNNNSLMYKGFIKLKAGTNDKLILFKPAKHFKEIGSESYICYRQVAHNLLMRYNLSYTGEFLIL